MAEMTVPTSVAEITPTWLTEALKTSGALPNGTVTAVEAQIIGEGVGMVGQLARLTISFSTDNSPPARAVPMTWHIYSRNPSQQIIVASMRTDF